MIVRTQPSRRGSTRLWAGGLLVLALLAGLFFWPRRAGVEAGLARPRNVLLVVVDTLRANRLGCYGYPRPTSPNIDALARRGTLYRRNYSQACWTLPSMVSLMSGRSVVDEIKQLPEEAPVLGETLAAAGFETAGFVANKGLGHDSGFQRGYQTFVVEDNVDALELSEAFRGWHAARTERARSGAEARPWFAWVQFIDPHEPYEPDPAHDVFHGPRVDQPRLDAALALAREEAAVLSPDPPTPSFEKARVRAIADSNRYDGEVLCADEGVGRVLDRLREANELENTLVILCADHGEMLYEHRQQPVFTQAALKANGHLPAGVLDLFGHGHRPWYFDDLWNTPLLIAGPGFPAGAERTTLSANLDLVPTVLEALGLARPVTLEGTSLWGGREADHERVFAHGHRVSAVVERSGWKLVVEPPVMFALPADAPPKLELFDRALDPGEDLDLAATKPDECARLLREIEAWRSRAPHYDASRTGAKQIQVLKHLGYVDDER